MEEELATQVSNAMTEATAPVAEKSVEEVSSPDVKTEQAAQPEGEKRVVTNAVEVDSSKFREQIENLNKAISIEREEKADLKKEIEKYKPFMEKMQSAFAPEKEPEVTEQEKRYMTPEEVEAMFQQRELDKKIELEQSKVQEKISKQVEDMTSKWNGEDGKPLYNDSEVIEWQRDNQKLYLMPEEAFLLMKRDDIINWETKQLMSKAKSDVSAEKPSGMSAEHNPSAITPKTDAEIKAAIFEALGSID